MPSFVENIKNLNLISRASAVFDQVTVTVMYNIHKNGIVPIEKRVELLRKACADYPNVTVDRWDGLLAEYMYQKNERIIAIILSHWLLAL